MSHLCTKREYKSANQTVQYVAKEWIHSFFSVTLMAINMPRSTTDPWTHSKQQNTQEK